MTLARRDLLVPLFLARARGGVLKWLIAVASVGAVWAGGAAVGAAHTFTLLVCSAGGDHCDKCADANAEPGPLGGCDWPSDWA